MAREGSDFSTPDMMYPPVADGAPSRAMVAMPSYPPPAPAFPGFAPRGPEILYGGFNQTWLSNCLRRRWLMALLCAAAGNHVSGRTMSFKQNTTGNRVSQTIPFPNLSLGTRGN